LNMPQEDVDFKIINENWSYFKLKDGTIIRGRVVVRKIVKRGVDKLGYPLYDINYTNVFSAKVPEDLLREPGREPITLTKEDIECEFNYPNEVEVVKENIQRYETEDGYIIEIKLVPLKVLRLKKANRFGEPIYVIHSQVLVNVRRQEQN